MAEPVVVIGGGFFGVSLALQLRKRGQRVTLLEMQPDLLQRASYGNQARVHNGYHYPRSFLTALRSHLNFKRFAEDYPECIDRSFEKYYAIARQFSKVTARQYLRFFERVGSPLTPARPEIQRLFNSHLIEAVFQVTEFAFDAVRLKNRLWADLRTCGVNVRLNTRARCVSRSQSDKYLEVRIESPEQPGETLRAAHVYNCTYSGINQLLTGSELPIIPLKHELTEMCLVKMPPELAGLGVTLMCGPFFSFMPFPPRPGLHTLSHVRYTPHAFWIEDGSSRCHDPYQALEAFPRRSHFPHIQRDAQRYIPALGRCSQIDSIWEVKTILPRSELDDGRPILLKPDWGLQGLTCIMGGKIDNVYDVSQALEADQDHHAIR